MRIPRAKSVDLNKLHLVLPIRIHCSDDHQLDNIQIDKEEFKSAVGASKDVIHLN